MKVYVVRPTRGRPYYMLSKQLLYKTIETEMPEEEAEKLNQINIDFQHSQAYLAKLYHKYDETLHAEGIEQ